MDAGSRADEGDARYRQAVQQATLGTIKTLLDQAAALQGDLAMDEADRAGKPRPSPAAANRVPLVGSSVTEPQDLAQDGVALQDTLDQVDHALIEIERSLRVALTVILGRSQLLRRQALATGVPDQRLLRALNEIDAAVEHIVLRLAAPTPRWLPPRPPDQRREPS